ncbi:MAG: phosphatase PAP2 family protein [Novosphingobium sp.]
MGRNTTLGLAGALALAATGVAVFAQQPAPAPVPAAVTGFFAMTGYLPRGAAPDSLLLNPPPPAPGSPAEARDLAAAEAAVALHDTARWALATRDADFMSPAATSAFSCAAGFAIGPVTTPLLDKLMQRTARDLAGATGATKRKYMRPRPFIMNGKPMCTPAMDHVLRGDGSYPSGHSSLGFGWGLVLAEAIPERTAQLVARGRAFGDSRRICNVHWLSDIEEGRVVASAVVARLNAEPAFQADLAAARAEAAALATRDPGQDCSAEAALLAL